MAYGLHRTRVNVKFEGETVKGSICCLLRDKETADLFLLSCKHVFGLSDRIGLCSGTLDARIDLRDPDHIIIAHVARPGDLASCFPGTDLYSLDAAIARVDNLDVISSKINGVIARSIGDKPKLGVNVLVPAASGELRGRIEAVENDRWIPYSCGSENSTSRVQCWLKFPTVIEYRPVGPKPQPGDSGAALMLEDGTLVGMHFALTAEDRGLAMLAKDVIRDTTFGRPIELVSDYNVERAK